MARLIKNSEGRKESFRRLAFDLEMNYVEEDEWGMLTRLKDFHLFKQGGRKKIFNILEKKDAFLEEQFFIFDYQYVISTGKTTQWFNQTVFFIQSKKLGLPEFLMKPENFFHKIGSFLGMQDIDFEQHPDFSGKYLLQSEDEDRLRYMFEDAVLRFFTVEKNWSLEGVGYFLIFYKAKTLLPPNIISEFFQKGLYIYKLMQDK